jgi:hypothetical protein
LYAAKKTCRQEIKDKEGQKGRNPLFTSKKHDNSGREQKENKFAATHAANLLEIYAILTRKKNR